MAKTVITDAGRALFRQIVERAGGEFDSSEPHERVRPSRQEILTRLAKLDPRIVGDQLLNAMRIDLRQGGYLLDDRSYDADAFHACLDLLREDRPNPATDVWNGTGRDGSHRDEWPTLLRMVSVENVPGKD